MSTEVKKEGETKDNTQKKKELEDKIAKISVKGTEESLKCFEELKNLNKTLNEIESVKDISKIYKTIFPKFEDHSFTKIRNAVMNEGKIKGGGVNIKSELGVLKKFKMIKPNVPVTKQDGSPWKHTYKAGATLVVSKIRIKEDGKIEILIDNKASRIPKSASDFVKYTWIDSESDGTDNIEPVEYSKKDAPKIENLMKKKQEKEEKEKKKKEAEEEKEKKKKEAKEKVEEKLRQGITDFKQNETGLIFKSGDKCYVYLERKKASKFSTDKMKYDRQVFAAISISKLRVSDVIGKTELIKDQKLGKFMGGAMTDEQKRANRIAINVALEELHLAPGFTRQPEAALKKLNIAKEEIDADRSETADKIREKIQDLENLANQIINKRESRETKKYLLQGVEGNMFEGAFYEVVSVKNDLSSEMPIESIDLKTLQGKFTLKIVDPPEIDQEKAVQLLLDYQKAILDEYKNPTEEHLTKLYSIGNKIVEEIEKNPVLQNSDLHKNFVKNWKEKEKETANKNPKILADTREKMSAFAVNLDQAIIDKTGVDIKNKKGALGLGTMGVGIGIAEALYPGVSSGVGQYLLAAISSHPVLATIVVAAVVAAKHFKPGEPDDYLTMYMGTELAPQLQIFERKRLTAKTGTTGDLGLSYTKFVTEVLVPKAKGYLTGSELITLITSDNIRNGVKEIDNFQKFDTELILKGGSLNLDTLLGQKLDAIIDSEISKLEAKAEQIRIQISQLEGSNTQKQANALEQQARSIEGEIKAKKSEKQKFLDTLKTIRDDITAVVIKYLNGEYGSKGGGPVDEKDKDEVTQTLTELLQSREIAEKISDHIINIIKFRIEITKLVEQLKKINTELEEVSPKELSKLEQVSKGTHPMIYAKFVKTFGPEKGDKMFSKVFSSTIKRTMSAEENLATLFDENRKADLERVLVDENSITKAKLRELCNSYKEELAKKAEKKKKAAEEKKAREDKLKGERTSQTSTTSQGEDIDVSGITSSISGLATSAYDKLTGLTGMVKDEKDKMSKDTLTPDLKTPDLQLKEVKSEKRSYKPGDHKPEDLTTITRKELDELRESEETLRKQLEMDRAIIRQYKQNIEHDISEHYKVLKMKEEQLLQKSDYVLREQQKIVAYYMGVLQNRESIIMEQERLLEMKRKRELEEIEELRAKIQHKLIKELEKEKKMMVKHHKKQMRRQKSLLQAELDEYSGDNLYLSQLASKTKSDKGSLKRGTLKKGALKRGTLKKEKSVIVQKSFMNTFVY